MNKLVTLLLAAILTAIQFCNAKTETLTTERQPAPFLFMENKGQIHDQHGNAVPHVLFSLSDGGFKAQLTTTGIHYYFQRIDNPEVLERQMPKPPKEGELPSMEPEMPDTTAIQYTIYRTEVELVGANPNPKIIKGTASDYYENYYLPGCGEEGVTDVHGFETVTYQNIYPGIDWVVYGKEGKIKYDFIVHAGADPKQIQLQYKGADGLKLNLDGSVTATTPLGDITEEKPYSYLQESKQKIASAYQFNGNVLSFNVAPQSVDFVIDPTIDWGTYYTTNSTVNYLCGLYPDGAGSVYISGYTNSHNNMATTGAHQTTYGGGGQDAYLAKFTAAGVRVWATYYGGWYWEYDCYVTGDGGSNIFLAGTTYGTISLATTGAHQTTLGGGYDTYLAKFTAAGVRVWATYYGGGSNDYVGGAACDASGNVYLSGYTVSNNNMATAGSYQPYFSGNWDAFIAKFNSSGVRQWGTYFGGSDYEWGAGVTCSSTGGVYLGGTTASTSGIATTGAHQTTYGGGLRDTYLAKFTDSGSLTWATYYGGSGLDGWPSPYAWGSNNMIDCDVNGDVYFASASTSSNAIATTGAYQTSLAGDYDAFLVKFNSSGVRQWGTYLGGSGKEYWGSVSTDNTGNYVYFASSTASTSGVATAGTHQTTYGGGVSDVFFAKFDAIGGFYGASYYGGAGHDWGVAIDFESSTGAFYIGGTTHSNSGIATAGAYQTAPYNGGYLVRFQDSVFSLALDALPLTYCEGDSIHIPFHANGLSTFSTTNVFTAELSNVYGSFSTPITVVGTKTSAATIDTIHGVLPIGTSGTNYKIRVTANSPFLISDTVDLIITPLVSPTVSISANNTTVCPSASVTFTATVTNGGTLPTYQWWKNGTAVGSNASTYTDNSWTAGDSVYCTVIGNAPCTANPNDTSSAIYLNVLPTVAPTISISSSGLTICPNQTITFTSLISNGGTAPVYQWKVNGVAVGTNSPTYAANNFNNGDVVTCDVTSNEPCPTPATVTSNALTVVVVNTVVPTITIAANDTFYCYGAPASFMVTSITNGGTLPQYQWKKNGQNVGTNSATYTDNSLVNGDVITCVLTSSHACAIPTQATSNQIVLNISSLLNPVIIKISNTVLQANTNVNSASLTYQWYLNGNPIAGATNQNLMITQNGVYQVWVTDIYGCTEKSATESIVNMSIANTITKEQISIYPNPTSGIVQIKSPRLLNATVRNTLGQVVLSEDRVQQINISHLAEGIYMLMLTDKDGRQVATVKLTKVE